MKSDIDGSNRGIIALLLLIKTFLCAGYFELFDILHHIRPTALLTVIVVINAIVLSAVQRPWKGSLPRDVRRPLVALGFFEAVCGVVWIYSIYIAGPLRVMLITEFPSALSALFGVCFASQDRQNQSFIFLVSSVILILFDGEFKGCGLALFQCLIIQRLASYRRQLESKIGGPKRTRTLVKGCQLLWMVPIFCISCFLEPVPNTEIQHLPTIAYIMPAVVSALLVQPFNYYVGVVGSMKLGPDRSNILLYKGTVISAFLWSYYWNHSFTAKVSGIYGRQAIPRQEHSVHFSTTLAAVGYFFSSSFNIQATSTRGSLIGYSSSGKPLYNLQDSYTLLNTNANIIKTFVVEVLNNPDSRSIFYFLCINLTFAFVELFCGVWNNSLGLISDSFHMFFDCSALVMGLVASVIAKWKPNKKYSYGFGRVEVLSGYVNSMFLMVIGLMLVKEAIYRLVSPPEVHTHHLLSVSVVGLIVNIIGFVSFSHAHSHGGEPCVQHNHSHGHSHDDEDSHHDHEHSHGHSHGHSHSGKERNENMHGVYLHILADLLGSVGVIVSSLLVKHYSWYRADPFCTLIIAIMIIVSVFPLFKSSAETLILRTPQSHQKGFHEALYKTMQIKDVLSYRDHKLWKFSSSVICASLVVQLTPNGNEQAIISQITQYLKEAKIHEITVQCEKEEFVDLLENLDKNESNFDYNTDVYHPERIEENMYI